jgi:inorganic pyrophosphatase
VADHGLEDELLALVEIPKGSRNKYEYDEGIGEVILDRFLSSSTVYPTDYGYLIGHRGRDGDPLDVLVCVSEPTFPGCVIPVKPIALFEMRDEKGQDDKIICVPLNDPVEIGGCHSRDKALEVIADAKRLHEEERGTGEEKG